jgi:V-type H+-transporting ATPase proteolipid subunit
MTKLLTWYFVYAGSGEVFNVSWFLEETSPYLWASTSIGLCIGFSILGAAWCVYHTATITAVV